MYMQQSCSTYSYITLAGSQPYWYSYGYTVNLWRHLILCVWILQGLDAVEQPRGADMHLYHMA